MKGFFDMCKHVKVKLGRELQNKEKGFLRWVYENHQNEIQNAKKAKNTGLGSRE